MAGGTVTINFTDKKLIVEALNNIQVARAHFTSGAYVEPADQIVPTMLAGFEYVADKYAADKISKPGTPFVLAINSDVSLSRMFDAANAKPEELAATENQLIRAHKVARPLQLQHPNRGVIVLFHDEPTPTDLYDHLAENGIDMPVLHEWGPGTELDAPRLEAAHNFSTVLALPSLNDERPIAWSATQRGNQMGNVEVVKLTEEIGPHDAPYITRSGELLFPLRHESLLKYGPKTPDASLDAGKPPALQI